MNLQLHVLDLSRRADFVAVMGRGSAESASCHCTAYHARDYGVACRERIFGEGVSDGYLAYADGAPVAWCQCGPCASFAMAPKGPEPPSPTFPSPHELAGSGAQGPDAWVVTCMVIVPEARGRGLAHGLMREVFAALRARGAGYVLATGHRLGPTYSSPLPELPESVCVKAGMTLVRDDPECPLYGMKL